jgi:carboxylesterase
VKGVKIRPEGANIAFLLVHGLAASSDELATLGQYLADNGYASFAVQLAGHGTTPEDLKATSWQDWYESAKKGLEVVKSWKPDFTFIVGLSMGGLLSVLLASEENEIDGMVLIGTALKVPGILPKFLPVLKYIKKWREVDIEQAQLVYDVKRFKYNREPVSAYQELFSLQNVAKKRLSAVSVPTIVLHGTEDKTIDPISGQIAYDNISSEEKELHMIEGAEHVISCHPTRTEAYPLILKFIERIVK